MNLSTRPIKSKEDIRKLGTILSVWAHPDDESFTCAGVLAQAVANGQTVVIVHATKGELGVQDESRWPADKLAEIRTKELQDAMAILGIKYHYWLGYADGACKDVPPQEGTEQVKKFIKQYHPDSIITFGPEGLTGHDDHKTVSRWATVAGRDYRIPVFHAVQLTAVYERMKAADERFNIFFNIDQPPLKEADECDIALKLDAGLLDKKYRCLSAMPSQTEAMLEYFGREFICEMFGVESFVKAD